MTRTIDFSQCHLRARELSERLYNSGREARLCWGSFQPATPVYTWDERWQERLKKYPVSATEGFVHFWVECGGLILDRSLMQFGGKTEAAIALTNDLRYVKYGYETIEGKRTKLPNTPHVIWDAYPEFG